MQNANRFIIFIGIAIGCISVIYFLLLILHIPYLIIILAVVGSLIGIYKWIGTEPEYNISFNRFQWWPHIILAACLCLMIRNMYPFTSKYGGWDAWTIWNYRARYLAEPKAWPRIFQDNAENSHPDYPLCMPAFLAFFIRLFSFRFDTIIPGVLSIFIAFSIPVLIYIENIKKNQVIATLVLIFFTQNAYYLSEAASQYADTLLAFFFLSALICINYASDRKFLTLSAFFLGCCMWTKNEGILLSIVFLLFYLPLFFSTKNIKHTLIGLAAPVCMLLLFKIGYAGTNDIVRGQKQDSLHLLLTPDRYKTIYQYFIKNLQEKFSYTQYAFYLYILVCIIKRSLPDKQMLLLISCLLGYMMVYVVTPHDLDWHLHTSQDRIMNQLMPAMIYVISLRLSTIQLNLFKKKLL